jgi:hypothetical protein
MAPHNSQPLVKLNALLRDLTRYANTCDRIAGEYEAIATRVTDGWAPGARSNAEIAARGERNLAAKVREWAAELEDGITGLER